MKYKIRENKDQLPLPFRKRSWKTNSAILLFCLFVLVFFAHSAFKVYINDKDAEVVMLNKQTKLDTLKQREEFLRTELTKLDTADGAERALREKFGVGRPGENLAIIVESTKPDTLPPSSFWDSIKAFFNNLFK